MASVFDVAKYILNKQGPMSAMKLQKLVYYAQAWSLVWEGEPLFAEKIEAWVNGPVCPKLYRAHRGMFQVRDSDFVNQGDARRLLGTQRETIDAVLDYYGKRSPVWLSELTHSEEPWKNARKGLEPHRRAHREITLESMAEYYETLLPIR